MSKSAADPERQLGRSIYGVFLLAIAAAIAGPVLSYESDLAELDAITQAHLQREARTHAAALAHHLDLVRAALVSLSARAQVVAKHGAIAFDADALAASRPLSPLLGTGLAILDAADHAVWRDPELPAAYAGCFRARTGCRGLGRDRRPPPRWWTGAPA